MRSRAPRRRGRSVTAAKVRRGHPKGRCPAPGARPPMSCGARIDVRQGDTQGGTCHRGGHKARIRWRDGPTVWPAWQSYGWPGGIWDGAAAGRHTATSTELIWRGRFAFHRCTAPGPVRGIRPWRAGWYRTAGDRQSPKVAGIAGYANPCGARTAMATAPPGTGCPRGGRGRPQGPAWPWDAGGGATCGAGPARSGGCRPFRGATRRAHCREVFAAGGGAARRPQPAQKHRAGGAAPVVPHAPHSRCISRGPAGREAPCRRGQDGELHEAGRVRRGAARSDIQPADRLTIPERPRITILWWGRLRAMPCSPARQNGSPAQYSTPHPICSTPRCRLGGSRPYAPRHIPSLGER